MKKRIINILLYILKKLGYSDVFKTTTIVDVSDFLRLDFKARESLAASRAYPPELDRTYVLRSEILEEVRKALLDEIVIIGSANYPCMYEAQLTIYTRKNKEQ